MFELLHLAFDLFLIWAMLLATTPGLKDGVPEMQFSDLTSAQQAELQNFLNTMLRPAVGTGARFIIGTVQPMLLDWGNYANTIVSGLDAGAIIPNTSGLIGSQALSKEDVITLMTGFANLIQQYADRATQNVQAKACGGHNLVLN